MTDKYISEEDKLLVKVEAGEYLGYLRRRSEETMAEHLKVQAELGELLKAMDVYTKMMQDRQKGLDQIEELYKGEAK
ncbi:MAG: hypothetical protein IKH75_14360 [Ruminococcus sp.]|nr:hypothetical protein [Ruminococcus sp.]